MIPEDAVNQLNELKVGLEQQHNLRIYFGFHGGLGGGYKPELYISCLPIVNRVSVHGAGTVVLMNIGFKEPQHILDITQQELDQVMVKLRQPELWQELQAKVDAEIQLRYREMAAAMVGSMYSWTMEEAVPGPHSVHDVQLPLTISDERINEWNQVPREVIAAVFSFLIPYLVDNWVGDKEPLKLAGFSDERKGLYLISSIMGKSKFPKTFPDEE